MARDVPPMKAGEPVYVETPEPCDPTAHRFTYHGGRSDTWGDRFVTLTVCENCGSSVLVSFGTK